MGFPFLAPIKPWVVDVLKERENNKYMVAFKNPWIVMTSGALVSKGKPSLDEKARIEEIKKIVEATTPSADSYRGCIISNNSNNVELSYSTEQTIAGIDFDGKKIKVEGESGRKISTPIIVSMDLDTDGANNTLKTAKISVKCFSLKQFEMFELFFMKPGMNVLIEWGDSSLLKKDTTPNPQPGSPQTQKRAKNTFKDGKKVEFEPFTRPEEAMVPKDKYDDFCKTFSNYFRSDTTAIGEYLQRIDRSLGSYDLVAGKVLDYSFSVAEDGTYDCSIEVSQGNQISLAIPQNQRTSKSSENTNAVTDEWPAPDQIQKFIVTDLNLNEERFTAALDGRGLDYWKNHWFNFVKINKQQKDTVASDQSYISMRFILKVLMNYSISGGNVDTSFFKFHLPTYKQGKDEIEVLPVLSNKYMMSSSDMVIFPRKDLPDLAAPVKTGGKPPAGDANKITIKEKGIDGTINGIDFHIPADLAVRITDEPIKVDEANGERLGDALNIFVKYKEVVKFWQQSATRIDFLEKILNMVNDAGYGLYRLVYGLQHENAVATIVDYKGATGDVLEQNKDVEIYRFKPTTINSIVKSFSFNFEMSNLVAGRTIFNSGKILAEAKKDQKTDDTDKLILPNSAYKSVDNSSFGNADGWYSINKVELENVRENFEKAKKLEKLKAASEESKKEDTTNEPTDMTTVLQNKSIKFLKTGSAKATTVLIYKDTPFFQDYILKESQKKEKSRSVLSPIEITLTIDGFSGFTCGQYFEIDGIPEIYNQIGVFQITNTKHNITSDGWTTTIEAGFRTINKTAPPAKT